MNMTSMEFGDTPEVSQQSVQTHKVAKMVNGAGALMSVALIVGIGVWGYKLLVRDVTDIPVVRALSGDMRVQPENPGGTQTAHQGLAVNRLQSEGVAERTADSVVLAPRAVDVMAADQAGMSAAAVTPSVEAADAEVAILAEPEISAPALLTETVPPATLPATVTDGDGVSATDAAVNEALALANQIAETATPLGAVAQATPTNIISADIAGVSRSPRPRTRPQGLAVAALAALAAPTAIAPVSTANAPRSVDPAAIAAGTRLAQLGAFDTVDVAKQEWDRLVGRFGEYMEGKSQVIQRAESGGRVFYRLRVMGFDDLSDARRFCSALLAERAACIPVKVR